jgi:hypothetical protein
MMRYTMLSVGLLSAAALGQDKIDLTIQPAAKAVRYTIESRSSSTSEREVLVDGEPMEGRGGFGGGGGGGATARESKVVFDEGREGGTTWRIYRHATAKMAMPGRDGEPVENEVEGGMLNERLSIVEDDRGVVVTREGDEGGELPPMMSRGIPTRTEFAGITPKDGVAVGAEFDLPAAFLAMFSSIDHPVRPAFDPEAFAGRGGGQRPPRGEGAGEGGGQRPPRGEGAGEGEGQRPPRGQGGQAGQAGARFGGAGMMGMFGGDPTLRLLTNDKLNGKVVGKLVEVKDGIARIQIQGTREAEGTLEEIGMAALGGAAGGRGGRGGRGGGQAPAAGGDGSVKLTLAGEIWVDVAQHALVKIVVEGKSHTTTQARMDRNEREIEMNATTDATFRYAVTAETSPEAGEGK